MSHDSALLSAQVNKLNIKDDDSTETSPSELVAVVDDMLNQLSTKFGSISSELIAKMDEMSRRLDSLEANIQAGNARRETDGDT